MLLFARFMPSEERKDEKEQGRKLSIFDNNMYTFNLLYYNSKEIRGMFFFMIWFKKKGSKDEYQRYSIRKKNCQIYL